MVPHRWPRLLTATIIAVGLLAIGSVVGLPDPADFVFRSVLLGIEVAVVLALGLIGPSFIRGLMGILKGSVA